MLWVSEVWSSNFYAAAVHFHLCIYVAVHHLLAGGQTTGNTLLWV